MRTFKEANEAQVTVRGTRPEAAPPPLRYESILRLQRTIGNRATAQMLRDQVQPEPVTEKTVDPATMTRLTQATAAIQFANNEIFKYGAGNQDADIDATKGVVKARADNVVDRSNRIVQKDFTKPDEIADIDLAVPQVLAQYYKAGVCDDFSAVTFNYLRKHAPGQPLTRGAVEGIGHAFVIMGNWRSGRGKEASTHLVVADPWPTRPQAVRWRDFFAYSESRSKIRPKQELVADGVDVVAAHSDKIQAREKKKHPKKLKLKKQNISDLKAKLNSSHDLWNHENTTASKKPVFYVLADWSEQTKKAEYRKFQDALVLNRHLSWKEKEKVKRRARRKIAR